MADSKKKKKSTGKNYGVADINRWTFPKLDLPQNWQDHLGNLPERFTMLIEGASGHGKTEYNGQLIKLFAIDLNRRVHMNCPEILKAPDWKEMWDRQGLDKIPPGNFTYAHEGLQDFETWFEYIRRSKARYIFLDSLDSINLTYDQFTRLKNTFKNRSFIMNCWNDPMNAESKKIKYWCQIKTQVKNFQAIPRSRFGGNKPHLIYREGYERMTGKKAPTQGSLF